MQGQRLLRDRIHSWGGGGGRGGAEVELERKINVQAFVQKGQVQTIIVTSPQVPIPIAMVAMILSVYK